MKKRVALIVTLLIILAGGITVCVLRWDAWFANPAEPLYHVPDEPGNIVLTFGEDARSERVVSWRAGKDTTAVSRLMLTDLQDGTTDTLPATTAFVRSRSGEAAFHRVYLSGLQAGDYRYQVETNGLQSEAFIFTIEDYNDPEDRDEFLLFGDLQYTDQAEATAFMRTAASASEAAEFYAYIGDIIERPTDEYWQLFFTSMEGRTATIPQVAALGNHEYLKGVRKHFDARWPYIFVNPQNGPERFLGRTYYVDFPYMRLIVLDTDALQNLSDHTVLRTWLTQVLRYESTGWKQTNKKNKRWNIVLMHHPVYSAGMGRDNPSVAWALRHVLEEADLVVAGHDHNYARHRHKGHTPAYVILSSSAKSYLPKCSPIEERLGSNHAFFSRLSVEQDTMFMQTYMVDSLNRPQVYDQLLFIRGEEYAEVIPGDSLPPELLDLPARYEGRSDMRVRRFMNRRNYRMQQAK